MNKSCKTCRGRGHWQSEITLNNGDTEIEWSECLDCFGTGIEQNPEDGDDFDIGGESYANE